MYPARATAAPSQTLPAGACSLPALYRFSIYIAWPQPQPDRAWRTAAQRQRWQRRCARQVHAAAPLWHARGGSACTPVLQPPRGSNQSIWLCSTTTHVSGAWSIVAPAVLGSASFPLCRGPAATSMLSWEFSGGIHQSACLPCGHADHDAELLARREPYLADHLARCQEMVNARRSGAAPHAWSLQFRLRQETFAR